MIKLTKRIVLIAFLASMALTSCEKKSEIPTEEASALDAEKIKLKKMERFISIMWQVPLNEVLFNEEKKEFLFGEVKMSKDRIEELYNISNEYHLKYEHN